MAITNFNQELWSALILQATREKIAYQNVVRNIGQVNGTKVHFGGIDAVTIGDYVKNQDMTLQDASDSGLTLDLNSSKYFNISLEDLDKITSNAALMTEIIRKGTDGLRNEAEKYIASLHGGAGITSGFGSTTTPLEINSANVNEIMLEASAALRKASADTQTLWAVIPVFMWRQIVQADEKLKTDNLEVMSDGFVGRKYGLNIHVSNFVANTDGSNYKIMIGDGDAIRYGQNVDKVEAIRHPSRFSDILRGLFCYGALVSRPETLLTISANEAAEPE